MRTRRGALAVLGGAGISLLGLMTEAGRKKKDKDKKKKDKKKKIVEPKPSWPTSASVQGTGPGVSSSFQLAAGLYRARAPAVATSSTGGLFFAHLYNAQELVDYVFIENPEYPGTYQYEELADVPANGAFYFFIDEAEGSWSISLQRL